MTKKLNKFQIGTLTTVDEQYDIWQIWLANLTTMDNNKEFNSLLYYDWHTHFLNCGIN